MTADVLEALADQQPWGMSKQATSKTPSTTLTAKKQQRDGPSNPEDETFPAYVVIERANRLIPIEM